MIKEKYKKFHEYFQYFLDAPDSIECWTGNGLRTKNWKKLLIDIEREFKRQGLDLDGLSKEHFVVISLLTQIGINRLELGSTGYKYQKRRKL